MGQNIARETLFWISIPETFIIGPGTLNWDFSVYKTFSVSERHRLQFRTEFFNVLNHPNLGNPGLTVGTANFGKITSASDPRELQFGLKYHF